MQQLVPGTGSKAQLVSNPVPVDGTCRIDCIIVSTDTVAGKIKLLQPNPWGCTTATQKLRPWYQQGSCGNLLN